MPSEPPVTTRDQLGRKICKYTFVPDVFLNTLRLKIEVLIEEEITIDLTIYGKIGVQEVSFSFIES